MLKVLPRRKIYMDADIGQLSCEWTPLVKVFFQPDGSYNLSFNSTGINHFAIDIAEAREACDAALAGPSGVEQWV